MPGTSGRSGGSNRKSARRRALLTGTRRRAAAAGELIARPERPAWLADPVAVAAWDRICTLLEDRGTLSEGDADAVLLAAVAESEYRQADALLAADGLVVMGLRGPTAHPAAKLRESAWKRWAAALSRLGLDPLARNRVDPAPGVGRHNPFIDYRQ